MITTNRLVLIPCLLSIYSLAAQEPDPCHPPADCARFIACNNTYTLMCANFADKNCALQSCTGSAIVTDSGQHNLEISVANSDGLTCNEIKYDKWRCINGVPDLSDHKELNCTSSCPGSGGGGGGGTPCLGEPDGSSCVGSPILVSSRGNRLELTSPEDGVNFDVDRDGIAERTSWTAPGTDDVFLVLDRNANGRIDDGAELFGDRTSQPPSDSPNGFEALAVFDSAAAGGNGDGWIDASDAIFGSLQFWLDQNHDGVSQPGELTAVGSSNVLRFALDYRQSRRIDRYGNEFRYFSLVRMDPFPRGPGRKLAVDVFLVRIP